MALITNNELNEIEQLYINQQSRLQELTEQLDNIDTPDNIINSLSAKIKELKAQQLATENLLKLLGYAFRQDDTGRPILYLLSDNSIKGDYTSRQYNNRLLRIYTALNDICSDELTDPIFKGELLDFTENLKAKIISQK